MDNMVLSAESIHYRVGRNDIIKDISFRFCGPQAVCILGPNGAGKSTLLKLISATLLSEQNNIRLSGLNPYIDRREYTQHIGYMPEVPFIAPMLNVAEQLNLMANTLSPDIENSAIKDVIHTCHLDNVLEVRCERLSLGYKQRLNLAQALLKSPDVLIMDEPLNGLDPHLIIEFRDIINELKKSVLVLFSTHYLAEAQKVSDKIMIMQHGVLQEIINLEKENFCDLEKIYMQHTKQLLKA